MISHHSDELFFLYSHSPTVKSVASHSVPKKNSIPESAITRLTKPQQVEAKKRFAKMIAAAGIPWSFLDGPYTRDYLQYIGSPSMSRRDFAEKHLLSLHAQVIAFREQKLLKENALTVTVRKVFVFPIFYLFLMYNRTLF